MRDYVTAGGTTTYFLYDGSSPVLEETYSASSGTTTIQVANGFADGWRERASGANGGFSAYAFDPQGTLQGEDVNSNTLRTAVNTYVYDGYGRFLVGLHVASGTLPETHQDPVQFGGQSGYYTDLSTGEVDLTHRYYDPSTGHFLNRDPIGYNGGQNLYAFCGNNPITGSDPDGTSDSSDFGLGELKSFGNFANELASGPSSAFLSEKERHPFQAGKHASEAEKDGLTFGAYLAVVGSLFTPAGAEGEAANGASAAKRLCFAADTPVQMADGATKPIEQVQAGNKVISCDPQTGEVEAKTVTRTFVHLTARVISLRLSDGETITCTPEHPIYVEGQGFFPAGQLTKGSLIVTRKGVSVSVAQVIWHPETTAGTLVYNIEVGDDHTYFVGKADEGIWAHNDCIPDLQGLRQALDAIERGDVRVATRAEAEQIARYFAAGFKNTTGMAGEEAELLTVLYKKSGYYHYQEEIVTDAETGVRSVAGHKAGSIHGTYRHLQIHPIPEIGPRGDVRRVFYGPLVH